MSRTDLGWVSLPYLAVFFGLLTLHSAWGALVGFHLALLPILVPCWKTIFPRRFAAVSKYVLWLAAGVGLSGGLGLWLVWPYAGLPANFPAQAAALGLSDLVWPFFIAYFALVNPWLEEAYWREALTSSSLYPVPVDFLFAGYHLIILSAFVGPVWMAFALLVLTAAGWFWRQVSRYTGSLLPATLSHMLADFSILLVLYSKA